jgi:hypothetical protein
MAAFKPYRPLAVRAKLYLWTSADGKIETEIELIESGEGPVIASHANKRNQMFALEKLRIKRNSPNKAIMFMVAFQSEKTSTSRRTNNWAFVPHRGHNPPVFSGRNAIDRSESFAEQLHVIYDGAGCPLKSNPELARRAENLEEASAIASLNLTFEILSGCRSADDQRSDCGQYG